MACCVGVHAGGCGACGVALHAGVSAVGGLVPTELKMRVNSPGPELAAGAAGGLGIGAAGGALGAAAAGAGEASGEFIALNICVKLPGPLPAGAGGGGAASAAATGLSACTAGKAGGVCPATEIFSIGTGLKTFASSSDGRETAPAFAGCVVFSACSMRVNSPCCGAGAGSGTGVGSAIKGAEGVGAAAGADAVAGDGSGLRASDASRSSSARGGAAGMVPKIPVALDCEPPGGSSEWGSFG